MRRLLSYCFAVGLAGPALATCPPAPDISDRLDLLIAQMRVVPDERSAQPVSDAMWAEYIRAPDARAQALLDEGMQRRQVFDLDGAEAALDELVAYCPEYAEGYNQRAFVNFIRGEFAAALPDLDRAIALNPRHVGALSGKGLTLISMGRVGEGQDAIRAAMAFNPWLSERHLLTMEPEPDRNGIDL